MKPSFALNLSEDGVTLLHRSGRGWTDVGTANFTDPDFTEALDYMRNTAMGLSPKGIATKLVIPNSQILYTTVTAPGPSEKQRRTQIAKALEGRTPYAVEDLVFDWSGDGPEVTVAVIAKETLGEAEAFASEHRFNPVSFVAIPDDGFAREPFFGTSSIANSIVPDGTSVERDMEIIRVVSRELPKLPEPAPEAAAPETEADKPDVSSLSGEEEAIPAPDQTEPTTVAQSEPPPEVEPELPQPDERAPAETSLVAASTDQMYPEKDATTSDKFVTETPVEARPTEALAAKSEAADTDVVAPLPPMAKQDIKVPEPAPVLEEADEAPMAIDVPPEDDIPPMPAHLRSRVATEKQLANDDDLPPAPSSAARMAFASRRSAETPPTPPAAPRLNVTAPEVPRSAPELGGNARTAAPKAPTVERPAGAKPPPKFSYDDPVPPPPRMPGDPPIVPVAAATKAAKGLKSLGNLVTAPGIPGARVKKPALPKPTQQAIKPAETTAATVTPDSLSRGLGARRVPQRGKPKYLGLIMTGILLLLLALVAAWSSIYLTQRLDAPETEVASTDQPKAAEPAAAIPNQPEPVAIAIDEGSAPTVDDEAAADGEDLSEPDVAASETPATGEEPVAEAAAPAPAPEPAPNTGVESEGLTAAEVGQQDQDEIFLAGMDTPPSSSDPLTLPSPTASADALPALPSPPPPFGTVYQFDADGRIVPTPEGIMTPEGVLLVAGKPPLVPPQRPESVIQAVAAVAPPSPAVADLPLTPTETFAADPTLADARPRVRPAELVPAAPAAGEDDASLAPAEDSRFSSLRPRLRPQAVLAAGEESRLAAENASLAAQAALSAAADAAVAEANSDGSISPLAVAVSRVPAPRPRDLNRAVEAAVAAATQPSSRKPAPEPEPEAAEESDEEPEEVRAAPRIPTKTNVAKQATFVNAINLSKVNLIGVYGTQSKRYALIRQSNGRYKKVRVGDRFDGGTIKAITSNEVRYQKGGRLVALSMPKG